MYTLIPVYVVVLVVFTLLTRCITIPINLQQRRSAAQAQRLQPKLRRIQQKYAGNQQKIQQETQALYAREGAAGMSMGCLPMFITMPIFFGIAGAVYYPLKYPLGLHKTYPGAIESLQNAYTRLMELSGTTTSAIAGKQVGIMEHLNELINSTDPTIVSAMKEVPQAAIDKIRDFDFSFLGMSLGGIPDWSSWSILVPIASLLFSIGVSVYSMVMQRKQNPGGQKQNALMIGCTTLGMPLFMFSFAIKMPVAINIYWATGSLFALVQGIIFSHTLTPNRVLARMMVDDTINRCAREKERGSLSVPNRTDI
jgi:YidC/Oxa1 family membrane protein insertase